MLDDSPDLLFARFRDRGDPCDLAAVFDAVAPGLLRVALHLTGEPHAAEDLVQETFVAAIEARYSFADERSVQAWLVGILRNRARRAWRRRGGEANAAGAARTAAARDGRGGDADPVRATLAAELSAELDAAIQALPETYRPVLRLHLRNQLAAHDIAIALERPPGSVRTQLVRGLALLRQSLPRGLAVGLLAAAVAPRGLAAVRAAVIDAAERLLPPAATPASIAPGTAAAAATRASLRPKALMAALLTIACALIGVAAVGPFASLPPAPGVPAADAATPDAPARSDAGERGTPSPAAVVQRTRVSPPAAPPQPSGTVLVRARWDDDGTPAAGVTVTLQAWGQPNMHLLERHGITNERGVVRIARVPTGEITAFTDVDGYPVRVEADRESVVDVREKRWANLTGTVVDAAGAPVAGASVMRSGYANPHVFAVATTDAAGHFAIDVGEARYVGARLGGHVDSYLQSVAAKKGETLDVTIRLRGPAASLDGTVRDDAGAAIPFALVTLPNVSAHVVEPPGGGQATHMPAPVVEADDQGRYRIDGIEPAQRVRVVARAPGFAAFEAVCNLPASEPRTLDATLLRGGTIEGHVRDARGNPVAKAFLHAHAGRLPQYADYASCTAQTAADGSFRLDSLPAGRLAVRVRHERLGTAETTIRLDTGATASWNPTLDPGPTIAGRVVDDAGRPRAGFHLQTASYDVNESRTRSATTDADGRFAFTGLTDEPLQLRVVAPESWIPCVTRHDVRPGSDDVVVAVPDERLPSARAHGVARGPDDTPLPGTTVMLGHGRERSLAGFTFDDRTGAFGLGPVPPGRYGVFATARGQPTVYRGVVELGANADVDLGTIDLGRAGTLQVHTPGGDAATQRGPGSDHFAVLTPDGEHVANGQLRDGEGRIDALAPGRYLVSFGDPATASSPRGRSSQSVQTKALLPFAITAGETTELEMRAPPRPTCTVTLRETDERKAHRPRDSIEIDLLDDEGRLLDRVVEWQRDRAGDAWPVEVLAADGPVTVVVRIEGHERARTRVQLRPGLEIPLR